MMNLEIDESAATFISGDRISGRYVHSDDFKPYLHPLRTPAGHTLSLAMPHDHKHHKGLMYSLSVPGVNFWEEYSTVPGEVPGRQRHERFTTVIETGTEVGFSEKLTWLPGNGGDAIFHEERSITCRESSSEAAFVWTWRTTLEILVDTELTLSRFAVEIAEGRRINYHGLGIRFRRDFGCTKGSRLLLDQEEIGISEGTGKSPREVEFQGRIDETWPVQQAAVRISQNQRNGLFVMQSPFAFLSLGPSNLGPVELKKGSTLAEEYEVTVLDLEPV